MDHALPDLADEARRIVVITGGTGGIGRRVARMVAAEGHVVVLPGRSAERLEGLCAELASETGNASVFHTVVDYLSLASVRACAATLVSALPRIDVLVNNAGRYRAGFEETEDGFESHLGINYLAPFLFTHLLLDAVRRSPRGRIVNVAGETARIACLDLDDLDRRRRFSVLGAYGQSKLALVMFTRVLAEAVSGEGISVSSMQPGMAATDHLAAGPGWLGGLWKAIAPSPEVAANAVARRALADDDDGGAYFFGTYRAPPPLPVYRTAQVDALYRRSLELVDLAPELALREVAHG